ncbi:LOW QUALITY PROTEIN: nischarin [Syngnathoides biaculeatus]|uniref:LOW QUALITY PROTEIN: nischarin n=1 Tax=Syngnathoides biaculeatus TaxID=300417 RepID=UPI002ADD89F2|nr:LOW QUALITY PROTEIN: nischarin [Syngnathoides biaculeatus]
MTLNPLTEPDATMDSLPFTEELSDRKVCVVSSELVENYTVYVIEVLDGEHKWTVKHRYSDFHDLHEKLAVENKVDRRLLPPKKILGKNSKSLVERRQKELELYLQTLLRQFPGATPTPLAAFLHFNLYEINGITAALAEELFHKGEQLLAAGEVFSLSPLQLHAITQQLRLAKPTCCNGDAKTDLGHILDFTCRLRYLKICGTRDPVGSSNILEASLPFDLTFFKSLLQIEISECTAQQIEGLPSLRSSVVTLNIRHSTDSMMVVLVPEASEFPQWEAEGSESGCPVTTVVPVWRNLTTLDMSHNAISAIDSSVKLIRKVEFLDLSHNQLSSVENLQHLYNLVHVDLSYNKICVLEAAHTRLGNIKTLSLAGNQLEQLTGLSKLYSLVHLDLTHNQLAQLEEIKNIGSLPCLEKLNVSSNPMCIIPDYRTKVLAQFGDRAAEVCLDGQVTTEKELDTVEVLKAIQKAKEVKDRMSGSDKKISEETGLSATAPPRLSPPPPPPPPSSSAPSSSSCCTSIIGPHSLTPPSSSAPSSSCQARQASCASQEMTSREETAIPPIILPSATSSTARIFPPDTIQVREPSVHLSECVNDAPVNPTPSLPEAACPSCSATWCPLLAPQLLSLTCGDQLFVGLLSEHLHAALKERGERKMETDKEEQEDEGCTSREVSSPIEGTEVGCPVSRDGYFEMGLDDSIQDSSLPHLPAGPAVPSVDLCDEGVLEKHVTNVLWCFCLKVDEEQLQQSVVCVALMDNILCLLRLSNDVKGTDLDADKDRTQSTKNVLSSLEVDLLLPFSQLLLSSHAELPASCLAFGLQNGTPRYYLFSEAQVLTRTRAELKRLTQGTEVTETVQILPRSLLNAWELEECQDAQGGYLTLFLPSHSSSNSHQLLSDDLPKTENLPSLLFLTHRYLWVLKMDVRELAERERSRTGPDRDCCRLVRISLGSVILHPNQKSDKEWKMIGGNSCLHPQHQFRLNHTAELLLNGGRHLLLFPLAQDKSSFLGELSRRRAALEELKVVALPLPCSCWPHQEEATKGHNRNADQCCCSRRFGSTNSSSRLRLEENQPSPHLAPGLSPGLKLLAGLDGEQLMTCFHRHIALSEEEELRQILWLSAVLYTAPEAELACSVLLSNDAVYFLLEDSAAACQSLSETDVSTSPDPNVRLCYCLTIRLSDLLSVNVGLFDQYFRVVGRSADHIVCCLSRDSYGTGVFLQELMSVLSLQQKIPAPEPSEQDFYSQFANTSTGKMQNYELVHSSRVKFVYPSEEEMGDLTFIVAERKTPACASASSSLSPCSFNVLLYLLVFQVQMANGQGADRSPVLHPRTLILTSTDVFLLDEDYVSYPLPDFAKEPPSRERYQLREARRIRDLDRVLLGYQTYPQGLTLVFDDLPGPDLLCRLTLDHFGAEGEEAPPPPPPCGGAEGEVQWCVFVPTADSRERLISLLARQWEALCSRELPVELTG